MAIKLAFRTTACPDWTLEQVAQKAAEFGYTGIDLQTLGAGSTALASDPALSEPAKVRDVLQAYSIEPVCLSTPVALHHRDVTAARNAHSQTLEYLQMAADIGCPFVRIFANAVEPGESRQSVIQRIAERVAPLADKAGELGVQLLFENAGSFCASKEWWWLLNIVDHPMVGMSWHVAFAAAVGEPPSVSVPALNSRIRLARVLDLNVGEGSGFVPLGEGDVGIQEFIKRLLGQGFDGYIVVEWDRLGLPSLTGAEEYLPDAAKRINDWLTAISELEEKGRQAAEKAAAKFAPKSKAELAELAAKVAAKAKAG